MTRDPRSSRRWDRGSRRPGSSATRVGPFRRRSDQGPDSLMGFQVSRSTSRNSTFILFVDRLTFRVVGSQFSVGPPGDDLPAEIRNLCALGLFPGPASPEEVVD